MPHRASPLFRHSLFVLRHLVPAELRRDIPACRSHNLEA